MSDKAVRAPGMPPRYISVPDDWKSPQGPYRQAPPEYGGEWWMVNPFTGDEPWKRARPVEPEPTRVLPYGFEDIFGREPQLGQPGRTRWLQDLEHYKQAGPPAWAEPAQIAVAEDVTLSWGMGKPRFYEGRYGWMARFPDSQLRDFETSAWAVLNVTHHVIAGYQIRLLQEGIVPPQQHPFAPPHLWPEEKQNPT